MAGADVDARDVAGTLAGILAGDIAGWVGGNGGAVFAADERAEAGGFWAVAGLAVFAANWIDVAGVTAVADVGLAVFADFIAGNVAGAALIIGMGP